MCTSNPGYQSSLTLPEVYSFTVAGQPVLITALPDLGKEDQTELGIATERLADLAKDRLGKLQLSPDQTMLFTKRSGDNSSIVDLVNESSGQNTGLTMDGMAALSVRRYLQSGATNAGSYSYNTPAATIQCVVTPLTGYDFECKLMNIPVKTVATGQETGVPGIGLVKFDIVFAGEFYLLTAADTLGIKLSHEKTMLRRMEDYGQWILRAAAINLKQINPFTMQEAIPSAVVFTGTDNNIPIQATVTPQGTINHSPGAAASCARVASQSAIEKPREATFIIRSPFGYQSLVAITEADSPSGTDIITMSVTLNVSLLQAGHLFG